MKNDSLVVLERALTILHHISTQTDASLAEVARETGLGKSTVFRLIASLETAGLLARQPDTQRYHVGPRMLEYSFAASRSSTLISVAHGQMVTLEKEVAETVGLHVMVADRRICVDEVESHNSLRFIHGVGNAGPLYAGAISKALLAFLPAAELQEVLPRLQPQRITPNTPVAPGQFEAELELTRSRGYALSSGELVTGGISLAAPVFNRLGDVAAALSVTGVKDRLVGDRLEPVIGSLCRTAQTISRTLGYHGHATYTPSAPTKAAGVHQTPDL